MRDTPAAEMVSGVVSTIVPSASKRTASTLELPVW
jgi:hypothetical protein